MVIRAVTSPGEVAVAIETIDEAVRDLVMPDDRRYRGIAENYPLYRELMLVAEIGDRVVGAVIGVGSPEGPGSQFSVLVRGLGVTGSYRGLGLGRQLIEELERRAAAMGAVEVHLGAVPSARGFYARLGYSGKSRMHKALTGAGTSRYGSGAERARRLEQMRQRRNERLAQQ